ncbi:MAG TPA: adenylosuccinate lyase [Gemmatimonadales bacterium]|nr:adenylosuccinate lyase [Gemmatimonadales bacterium]
MSEQERYVSPLATRYASPAMQRLWGAATRVGLWRRLWIALAEAERELGLAIPAEAIAEMQAHADDVDFARAAEYEARFRHDVMAHVHAFGDVAPAARPFIHLGATSAYVTDNADLLVMREALRLVELRLAAVLRAWRAAAVRYRAVPTLAWTHLQPAQLTTVGKRAALWMQGFASDLAEIRHRQGDLALLGCKGTTGTQASFLDLFAGDHKKVRRLDRCVAEKMGFARVVPISGQTYPRKADAQVLGALAGIAQSAAKCAADLRLLQHLGEVLEPFEAEQVGSSAMAYKRNPMRCERIASLARYAMHLPANAEETAAQQWFERTLDDSANRRVVLPEAFLAVDAILVLMADVAAGVEVREAVVARHVARELPFMATERCLMLGVKAGGDRQALHEVVRRHSLAVAQAVAERDAPNDLLERLAADPAFRGVPVAELARTLAPAAFVGRAPEQVDEFLREVIDPLVAGLPEAPPAEVKV